jgi:hypothetical protein
MQHRKRLDEDVSMRIASLNLGHRALKPKTVPLELLDALVGLEADLLFLNEFVTTPRYREELLSRWRTLCETPQLKHNDAGRWSNQIAALSNEPLAELPGLAPVPTQSAATNLMAVKFRTVVVTGMRAPAYPRSSDWYEYWSHLRDHLAGDVVIGDLNVDPRRGRKRDRVLPEGWRVVTPAGDSFQSRSRNATSAIDHALVRPEVEVMNARYATEFLHQWDLDHVPIVIDVKAK